MAEVKDRIASGEAVGLRPENIWLLGGQSNMQGAEPAPPDSPAASDVWMFSVDQTWKEGREPLHRIWEDRNSVQLRIHPVMYPESSKWIDSEFERRKGTPAQGEGGVGPGLPFAAELARLTGSPIGVVPCALGSTGLGLWTKEWADQNSSPDDPSGSLFYNLVDRARRTGAAGGLVWYQGEADSAPGAAETYAERFLQFLNDVRRELGNPGLPALVVQIASVDATHPKFQHLLKPGTERGWERVREEIRRLPELDPLIRIAVAADLPRWDVGHISAEGQRELGRRLALAALALRGRGEVPGLAGVERVEGDTNRLRVRCSGVDGPLRRFGPLDSAFELRRPDGTVARPALWAVAEDAVELRFEEPVGDGDQLVHGPGFQPHLAAKDARGLPLPCFGPVPVG